MFELIIIIPFMAFLALPVITLWLTRDAPALVFPNRGWIQGAMWVHFFLFGLFYSLGSLLSNPTGSVIPVFTAVASLTALYWLAFENVDPDKPDQIPFGLKAWLLFKHRQTLNRHGHVTEDDMRSPFPNPFGLAAERVNQFVARQKEEQLRAQEKTEQAEQAAYKAAEDRNRARARAEAQRQRTHNDG